MAYTTGIALGHSVEEAKLNTVPAPPCKCVVKVYEQRNLTFQSHHRIKINLARKLRMDEFGMVLIITRNRECRIYYWNAKRGKKAFDGPHQLQRPKPTRFNIFKALVVGVGPARNL